MRLKGANFGFTMGICRVSGVATDASGLPGDMARRLYKEIPVGTLVTVN